MTVMTAGNPDPPTRNIDPDWIAAVVRDVVARLRAANTAAQTAAATVSIADRIVTAESILQITGTPTEATIPDRAVITPAARDEARRRGIRLHRSGDVSKSLRCAAATPADEKTKIIDNANPERASAVAAQIAKRGITVGTKVVLSETPAFDVHHYGAVGGERAVMIQSLADVDRFAAELSPDVWVLDMVRINFIAAVNIVSRIAKC